MEHRVYAKCNGGRDLYLQVEFTGTRSQCETFIRLKVRQGRPTHFNFISRLPMDKAARRYLP